MPGEALVVSVRLNAELSRKVVEMCDRRGVTRAQVMKRLLERAVVLDEWLVDLHGPNYVALMGAGFEVTTASTESVETARLMHAQELRFKDKDLHRMKKEGGL